jgi:hypothetical protein
MYAIVRQLKSTEVFDSELVINSGDSLVEHSAASIKLKSLPFMD